MTANRRPFPTSECEGGLKRRFCRPARPVATVEPTVLWVIRLLGGSYALSKSGGCRGRAAEQFQGPPVRADGLNNVFPLNQVSERGIAIINRECDNIHSSFHVVSGMRVPRRFLASGVAVTTPMLRRDRFWEQRGWARAESSFIWVNVVDASSRRHIYATAIRLRSLALPVPKPQTVS